ncbi:hypothetical protein CLU79DRAFT_698637, partial [Phycomyces nitens]
SPGSIEFSGGHNDQTNTKNHRDTTKLYSKLILDSQSSLTIEIILCATDKGIYFEKLTGYNNMLFRSIHASIETPTSSKKLVGFVKEIPNILAWKQAVVDHTVGLK